MSIATPLSAPAGTIIFREGQPATGVFLVSSGAVRAQLPSARGADVLNRVLGSGALLGVPAAMCSKTYVFTAQSIDDATVLGYIETPALNDFLRTRPDLCMQVVTMMSDELLELRHTRDHMKTCTHSECSLYDSCKHCST